ncbi:MAG: hypothetical protein PHQ52_01895 [Candidatus Omnitrophica bacterium]|nr:hypothetical protein [Candidatus Omnitrophota bacterium]
MFTEEPFESIEYKDFSEKEVVADEDNEQSLFVFTSPSEDYTLVRNCGWGTVDTGSKDLKYKNKILMEGDDFNSTLERAIELDLDGNGLNDCVVFRQYFGNSIAVLQGKVDIFLRFSETEFQHIYYEGFCIGSEDFVDMDKDGKSEIIRLDLVRGADKKGKEHNYWGYNIYELVDGKMVNANEKYEGFPKYVWYTEKHNDKDTSHLTKEYREKLAKEQYSKIEQEKIRI